MAEDNGRMSFIDWLPSYREDQERLFRIQQEQAKNLQELTQVVAKMESTINGVVSGQQGIFSRINRPFRWEVFIAALALVASFSALALSPVYSELNRQYLFDKEVIDRRIIDARETGTLLERTEWLRELERRTNERLHANRSTY